MVVVDAGGGNEAKLENQPTGTKLEYRVKAINLVPESHDYGIATGGKPGLLHIAQIHKARVPMA